MRVAHFLDSLPLDLACPPARDLWGLLGDTYYRKDQAETLLRKAGIRLALIDFSGSMDIVWADILVKSRTQDRLGPLLQVIADGADTAVAARIRELVGPEPPAAPQTSAEAGDLDWKAAPAEDEGLDGEYAGPELFDPAFLRRASALADNVCRLLVTTPDGRRLCGDGLRVGERLVLTGHPVLYGGPGGGAAPVGAQAWFGFERRVAGNDQDPRIIDAIPASVRGDAVEGWGVIELETAPRDVAEAVKLLGAPAPRPGDRVQIIEHPYGGPKQIGMAHNEVRYVDDRVVQYRTAASMWSPGAPVFDADWQLIAFNDKYMTYNHNGFVEHRQEGRRIEQVAAALHALGMVD